MMVRGAPNVARVASRDIFVRPCPLLVRDSDPAPRRAPFRSGRDSCMSSAIRQLAPVRFSLSELSPSRDECPL
jgi:hypothetical protein